MLAYWIILTKSFYISKYDLNTKNDLKNIIKHHHDPFLWNLHTIPTKNDQKIGLIYQLDNQMICYDNFSMVRDI